MMRFYLDGTLVDPATNWQEVSSTIRRDKELNVFLLFQEYTLTFDGSGFDYLLGKINGPGFCTKVNIDIEKLCEDEWQIIFSGILFISDCEVNEKTGTIQAKVSDKSFFSKINNNKNIKTAIDAPLSKNQVDIDPVEIYDLELFNVTANASVRTVEACRVEEAFRYLIDFMTDKTVAFVSDTFGANGDWKGLAICTGYRLRGGISTDVLNRWIPFSFLQLFEEVNKRIPIILLVENPFTNPTVRIESIDYLYGQNIETICENVDEIKTSFDTDKLYAIVKFGSPTDDTNILNFPETINFFGFRQEEFHLLGTCNVDKTLDLSADWVVSSNIMERVITTAGGQDYDSNLFLITTIYTDDFTGRTTNDNFLNQNPPMYNYNALLNNASISDRYIEDFSASIAAFYVDSKEGQALGYLGTTNNITGPANWVNQITTVLPLNQESYDNGNYFNPTLYRYIALETAVYNIDAQITLKYIGAGVGINRGLYQLWLEHYDASNTKKATYQMWDPILNNNVSPYQIVAGTPSIGIDYEVINLGNFSANYGGAGEYRAKINGSLSPFNINMVQGDYLQLKVYYEAYSLSPFYSPFPNPLVAYSSQNVDALQGANKTFIKCVNTSVVGAVYLNIDEDQFRIQKHKFTYPIQQGTFDTILNNPIGRIGFGMASQAFRYGWIDELKYNHFTNIAEFTLTTNRKSQNAY